MNRDRLRFRIWSEKLKRYYWSYAINVDGDLVPWAGGIGKQDEDPSSKLTIEPCIGLRDRNGKLIYEGDLVVMPNQYPYFDYADDVSHKSLNDTFGIIEHDAVLNYVGIVEWDDESAQFVIVLQCVNPSKSGISNGDCHCFGEEENLEIIGNIHEMEATK